MAGKRKREPPVAAGALVVPAINASLSSATATTYTPTQLAEGVETTVEFAAPRDTTFVLKLTVENGEHLRIWAEDCTSKEQWQTDKLAVADFVGVNAAIPGASLGDYATCFLNCLNAREHNASSVEIADSDGEQGDLELHLGITVKVFASEWKPQYVFLLKQVQRDPLDRVFARMRDQEECIQDQAARIIELEEQVRELTEEQSSMRAEIDSRRTSAPAFFRADASTTTPTNHVIPWKVSIAAGPALTSRADRICFPASGAFVVHVYVSHSSTTHGTVFDLLLNDKVVATCVGAGVNASGYYQTHRQTASLSHFLTVARRDRLAVAYKGDGSAYKQSYIVLYEVR